MTTRRPAPLRPRIELLEHRDQPSANLPLANTFAVGTDAVAVDGTGSTAAVFSANGGLLFPGGRDSFTPVDFNQREVGTNHVIPFTGGIRTAMADFNRDGVNDIALAMGPTIAANVLDAQSRYKIVNGATGEDLLSADAPFLGFSGGLFVAVGDINNDGAADLAVSPDTSGGPRVTIFTLSGGRFVELANFFAIDDPNFRGGCRPAFGDVNGDGADDLVVSAGFGGGPRISVFNGTTLSTGPTRLVPDFFLFEQDLRNGAFVAVGDVTADGRADIIGGGGPGGGPRVLIISGDVVLTAGSASAIARPVGSFFAGFETSRGGVRVAAKRLDGDPFADLVTASGSNDSPQVRIFDGERLNMGAAQADTLRGFFSPYPDYRGGLFVG